MNAILHPVFSHRPPPRSVLSSATQLWAACMFFLTLIACSDVVVVNSPARLELAPQVLVFPDVRLGGQSEATVTIYEVSGQASSYLQAAVLEGTDAARFQVVGFEPSTLRPGQSLTLTLRFEGNLQGNASASLRLIAENLGAELSPVSLMARTLGPDNDGDGISVEEGDCDDSSAASSPSQPESCDGIDNNCDGEADEGLPTLTYYVDLDADGYGGLTPVGEGCSVPADATLYSGDCDDLNPTISPAAEEICDSADQNCNGLADEGLALLVSYPDDDGDGFGRSADASEDCAALPNTVDKGGDCDDLDPQVYPNAPEICDDRDQSYDGQADEGLPTALYYPDLDADGYGAVGKGLSSCRPLDGLILNGQDCLDSDATVHPNATEHCDGRDEDCDGLLDDNATDFKTWYRDGDGDGFGGTQLLQVCTPPTGYVVATGDCRDDVASIYPGADEYCNRLDDDCDGSVDEEAVDQVAYAQDADGDGYGDEPLTYSCTPLAGQVLVDENHPADCDDSDAAYHPNADESCDGEDYNCDGDWQPKSCSGCHVGKDPSTSLYRTLQEALNLAAAGEDFGGEVRVCPGTYVENLRFYGAPVILKATDPTQTVLDGRQCVRGQSECSAVQLIDGEDNRSGLAGFTILGGRGTTRGALQSSSDATRLGGAVLIYHGSASLTDLSLSGYDAQLGSGFYLEQAAGALLTRITLGAGAQTATAGAGLYALGGHFKVEGLQATGLKVNENGGALYLENVSSAQLSGLTLSQHVAALNGGAIYAKNSVLEMNDIHIESSSANAQSGGGMAIEGGRLELYRGTFLNNHVAGGNETQGGGGLLVRGASALVLQELSFEGNDSRGNGGGLAVVNTPSAWLEQLVLSGNTASSYGGGLALVGSGSSGGVTVIDSDLEGNQARFGAGLWLLNTQLELRHSTFFENISGEFGGALMGQSAHLTAHNIIVLLNQGRQGAGFYLEECSGQLINLTFERQSARERASHLKLVGSSLPSVSSSIFSRGTDTNGDLGIEAPSTFASLFRYNDLFDDKASGFTPDSSNLGLDPLFVSATGSMSLSAWDLHLKPGSPCKDAGDPSSTAQDGNGTRNDMGAYGGPEGSW